MKILVVDDEKSIVKGIKFNLEHEGYEVEAAGDGAEALALIKESSFDLIIMDLMMPNMDGLEACRQIREFSGVPIIMLTARGEDIDKLIGFDYGADDYMTKPFNIIELKARIRAILRRSGTASGNAGSQDEISIGRITINTAKRDIRVDGRPVDLTAKEFDLVVHFMSNPGRVYSRENLLNLVWGYEYPGEMRAVDVHVRRLREKLEEDPAHPEFILTKWGVGYYFKA
ncbi:MAG: response regulator transcription factor [Oscillospiraceae bacterium]|nr:response regulator transcription factor [Oscillospiraceae bacterium]